MKIEFLTKHEYIIPEMTKWFWNEWRRLYKNKTIADVEKSIRERLNEDKIPCALVAVENNKIIGTGSIKIYDMETRKDLSPWLAGLYVIPEFRNKGVGSKLVKAVEMKAKEFGFKKLYLYTPKSEHFYDQLGWALIERVNYNDNQVSLMEKSFPI